jgi:hypothetical protein
MRCVISTVFAFVLVGCSDSEKGDIVRVRDIPSPDGRYVATVFGERFYITTGDYEHVYLRRTGQKRGDTGNVCVFPPGDYVTVSWTSPTNLLVSYRSESLYSGPSTTNIDGVTVGFSEMPLPHHD